MPSVLIGYPILSGAQPLISGNPWSGNFSPQGGVQLRLAKNASGNIYVGFSGGPTLSGGLTLNSGSFFLSGGGLLDGMEVGPGDAYWIPKMAAWAVSGTFGLYCRFDPAVSGQGRAYYEVF